MVMREVYANNYLPSSKDKTLENYLYHTVMKYPEEDVMSCLDRYSMTLKEYVRYDVKKYFGLNLEEYLNLTYKEKYAILDICKDESTRLLKIAEDAKAASDREMKNTKKSMEKAVNPNRLRGFDLNGVLGIDEE